MNKVACLTVDVERDYGDLCHMPSYDALALIPSLRKWAESNQVPLSWFIQGSLFQDHPTEVGRIGTCASGEIYLHGYSHRDPRNVDHVSEIERGVAAFQAFCGRSPVGYRAPLGVISRRELSFLSESGFAFDSSVFPTWRPGRFCHLIAPNHPHVLRWNHLLEIPFSVVSRLVPIPLSLSYLKLSGGFFRRMLGDMPLPETIVVGMHLHDLESLPASESLTARRRWVEPWLFRRIYGVGAPSGWTILGELASLLQRRGYRFVRVSELVAGYVGEIL